MKGNCKGKGALLYARATAALVEALGMISENLHRLNNGNGVAYGDEQFNELLRRYQLSEAALSSGDFAALLAGLVSVAEHDEPKKAKGPFYKSTAKGYPRSRTLELDFLGACALLEEELDRQEGLPIEVITPRGKTFEVGSRFDLLRFREEEGRIREAGEKAEPATREPRRYTVTAGDGQRTVRAQRVTREMIEDALLPALTDGTPWTDGFKITSDAGDEFEVRTLEDLGIWRSWQEARDEIVDNKAKLSIRLSDRAGWVASGDVVDQLEGFAPSLQEIRDKLVKPLLRELTFDEGEIDRLFGGTTGEIRIRFDHLPGGPGEEARFVEAENDRGESIRLDWRQDGDTALLIVPSDAELRERLHRSEATARRALEVAMEEGDPKKRLERVIMVLD